MIVVLVEAADDDDDDDADDDAADAANLTVHLLACWPAVGRQPLKSGRRPRRLLLPGGPSVVTEGCLRS